MAPPSLDDSPSRPASWGLALLLLALSVVTGADRARSEDASEPAAAAPRERQVMVTFPLTRATGRRAAGSTRGGYAGPDGYTASTRTRLMMKRVAKQHGLRRISEWPMPALKVLCVVFEVPKGHGVDAMLKTLRRDERVESAQRVHDFRVLEGDVEPSDEAYAELQHALTSLRVWETHPWSQGRGVTVAVVDTAVDLRHSDLSDSVRMARNFVDDAAPRSVHERHGTAVSGIVASAGNGVGTVGVAPATRLLALRACWEDDDAGRCDSFSLAKALSFVVEHRPDVVNLSLVGPRDPLLERLLERVIEEGSIVVTAHDATIGKDGFPTAVPGVLPVANAADLGGGRPHSSVLVAPGQEILAAVPGQSFDFVSGSSFAAAHVSGIAALLLEHSPDTSADELHDLLRRTSRDVDGSPSDGLPLIDACEALASVVEEMSCPSGDRVLASAGTS
ncbi:MAG: S8 family serine peptidase [Acidobacteriota bacterium]